MGTVRVNRPLVHQLLKLHSQTDKILFVDPQHLSKIVELFTSHQ